MSENKRSNMGYEIIENCIIGKNELVIGHNPNAPAPYVCWYCRGDNNYFWGYYCNDLTAAREKLSERYQSEIHMPYNIKNSAESGQDISTKDRDVGDDYER